jgi:hypothetical protein
VPQHACWGGVPRPPLCLCDLHAELAADSCGNSYAHAVKGALLSFATLLIGCAGAAGDSASVPKPAADSGSDNPIMLLTPIDASLSRPPRGPCEATFQAISRGIFEGTGCSLGVCHTTPGPDTPAAGLDLTPEDAYQALVGVTARALVSPPMLRVAPGDERASLLYLKVAAAEPMAAPLPAGGGAPMPLGLAPLGQGDLTTLRAWIRAGAPETGIVEGTEAAVAACRSAGE